MKNFSSGAGLRPVELFRLTAKLRQSRSSGGGDPAERELQRRRSGGTGAPAAEVRRSGSSSGGGPAERELRRRKSGGAGAPAAEANL